jgi:endogenous inhibitor of DNA gyrase (YacG/DUF329 family)
LLLSDADRPATFPFCSIRCRQRDLGAWFNDRYIVAGDDLSADALTDMAEMRSESAHP